MNYDKIREDAVSAYNACWALLSAERTDAEDAELIAAAFESRRNWQIAGGPQEHAVADWMVSRAAAATGNPRLALTFAWASLEHDGTAFPEWLKASLLEGLARAMIAGGAVEQAQTVVTRAHEVLAGESNAEDAAIITAQLEELAL